MKISEEEAEKRARIAAGGNASRMTCVMLFLLPFFLFFQEGKERKQPMQDGPELSYGELMMSNQVWKLPELPNIRSVVHSSEYKTEWM